MFSYIYINTAGIASPTGWSYTSHARHQQSIVVLDMAATHAFSVYLVTVGLQRT